MLRVRQHPLAATIVSTVLALLGFMAPSAAAQDDFPAPPTAPQVTAGPSSPDNDLAPTWSFRSDDITNFECSLYRGETLVGDWTACTSPAAYDLTGQPDGDYTFAVRAIGADGVISEPAAHAYTLDTSVPPLPTIVTLPGPASSDRTPAWTFTGGTEETFECRVTGGDDVIGGWDACSSPHTVDLSGEPDGDYTFAIRGVSDQGTPGPVRTDGYALDTQAPAAPELTTAPAQIGGARGATLGFTAEAGAQVDCRALATDGSVASDWVPCLPSPYTFDLGSLPDGEYTLALRATDEAGNASAEQSTRYTLDTTAPAAPAVEVPAVTPATRLQPNFTFAAEDGATVECRFDGPGGFSIGWQACTSPAPYDLTGQPDGTYTFAVRATDAAGNTSDAGATSYSLARDPDAVNLQDGPGRTGKTRQPRWTFEAEGVSGFTCSLELDSGTLFRAAPCGSPRTYNLSGKPDGDYKFTVRARKGPDGVEPAVQQYDLDSAAPARPVVEAKPVSPASDATPAWRFSGEKGAALECRVAQGSAAVIDWTPCGTPRDFDLSESPDGTYTVATRARDAAGNTSGAAISSYVLDRTAPAEPELTAAPNAEENDRSPTWDFAGEEGATYSCTLSRDDTVVSAKSSCADTRTYNLSRAQPGTYTFSVQATDAAGNTSKARSSSYVLAKAPATKPSGGGSGSNGSGDGSGASGSGDGSAVDPAGGAGGGAGSDGSGSGEPRGNGGFRTPTTSGGSASPAATPGGTTNDSSPGDGAGSGSGVTAGSGSGPGGAGSGSGSGGGAGDGGDASGSGSDDRAASSRDDRENGFTRRLRERADDAVLGLPGVLSTDVVRAVFPMSLLILLGGFLLVQGRIDRGDPKLAMAPIDADPDLEFAPPPTHR